MFIVRVLFLKFLIITVNYNSMDQYENGSLTFIIAWHLWNMSISISICLYSWSSVESPINNEKSKNSRSLCNFLKLQETRLLRYTKGLMKKLNLLGFLQCHDAFGDIKFSFGVYAHNLSSNEIFVKRLNQYYNTTRTARSANSKSGFSEWFAQKLFYYYYCRLQATTIQGADVINISNSVTLQIMRRRDKWQYCII